MHPDSVPEKEEKVNFEKELEELINKHCMENGSDTPDFILAKYLCKCLDAFNRAVKRRTEWYKPEQTRKE